MKTPESGTEVFDTIRRTGTGSRSTITGHGVYVDLAYKQEIRTLTTQWAARLTNNKFLKSSTQMQKLRATCNQMLGMSRGLMLSQGGFNYSTRRFLFYWILQTRHRLHGCGGLYWSGSRVLPKTHNLGVVPELMIVKEQNSCETVGMYILLLTGDYIGCNLNQLQLSAYNDWDNASDVGVAPTAHTSMLQEEEHVNNLRITT